jgi:hypothetical protein
MPIPETQKYNANPHASQTSASGARRNLAAGTAKSNAGKKPGRKAHSVISPTALHS